MKNLLLASLAKTIEALELQLGEHKTNFVDDAPHTIHWHLKEILVKSTCLQFFKGRLDYISSDEVDEAEVCKIIAHNIKQNIKMGLFKSTANSSCENRLVEHKSNMEALETITKFYANFISSNKLEGMFSAETMVFVDLIRF